MDRLGNIVMIYGVRNYNNGKHGSESLPTRAGMTTASVLGLAMLAVAGMVVGMDAGSATTYVIAPEAFALDNQHQLNITWQVGRSNGLSFDRNMPDLDGAVADWNNRYNNAGWWLGDVSDAKRDSVKQKVRADMDRHKANVQKALGIWTESYHGVTFVEAPPNGHDPHLVVVIAHHYEGSSACFNCLYDGPWILVAEDLRETKFANAVVQELNRVFTLSDSESITAKPVPVGDSVEEWKEYMLYLINAERSAVGLGSVVLGNNTAAQAHADSMLANCFGSHWGMDGLKPYMRYTLAGGYHPNAENVSALGYCIQPWENYVSTAPQRDIDDAMDGFMESAGHMDNILDPHHAKVNLGLAWDDYNMVVVQHFEYDYVMLTNPPAIHPGGIMTFSGTLNGMDLMSANDMQLQIYYDPPPHNLTTGQLARTYCYDNGRNVWDIVPPLPAGYYYPVKTTTYYATPLSCPDPYDVPASAPAPSSPEQAHAVFREVRDAAHGRTCSDINGGMIMCTVDTHIASPVIVPFDEASMWRVSGNDFSIGANLETLLGRNGPGVYTIILWGVVNGEDVPVMEYPIFYENPQGFVPPPTQPTQLVDAPPPDYPPTPHTDYPPNHPAINFFVTNAKYDRVSGMLNVTFTQDVGGVDLWYVRMSGSGASSTLVGADVAYKGSMAYITLTNQDVENFKGADVVRLVFNEYAVTRSDTMFMLPQTLMIDIIR